MQAPVETQVLDRRQPTLELLVAVEESVLEKDVYVCVREFACRGVTA